MSDTKSVDRNAAESEVSSESRRAYEAPRITKKRSVARVTLLTGTGATSTGALSSFN